MAEECPITREELKLPYEQLVEIAKQRNVNLKLTPEEKLKLPELSAQWHESKVPQNNPFYRCWSNALFKFSRENIQKFNLLYDTTCRNLVANEMLSLNGMTFTDELQFEMDVATVSPGYADTDDSMSSHDEMDEYNGIMDEYADMFGDYEFGRTADDLSDSTDCSTDCSSSESEGRSRCNYREGSGRKRRYSDSDGSLDSFDDSDSELERSRCNRRHRSRRSAFGNWRRKTVSYNFFRDYDLMNIGRSAFWFRNTLDPYSAAIAEANPANDNRDGSFTLKTVLDLPRALFKSQTERSSDKDLRGYNPVPTNKRANAVDSSPVHRETFIVHLGDDITKWSKFVRLVYRTDRLMGPVNMLTGYSFRRCVDEDSPRQLVVSYRCGYDRPVSDKGSLSDYCTPLNCLGRLTVAVSVKYKFIRFDHSHKLHYCDNYEGRHGELTRNMLEKAFLHLGFAAGRGQPRSKYIIAMNGVSTHSVCRFIFGTYYDMTLRTAYRMSSSVWLSTLTEYRQPKKRNEIAHFIFHSPGLVGLAFIFKQTIRKLLRNGSSFPLSVSINHGVSAQQCEMAVVSVTINTVCIPIGYMFFDDASVVTRDLKVGGVVYPDEKKPFLPCEVAKEIASVSNSTFPCDSKAALLTSFLMLFKGTDKETFVHRNANGGYNHVPHSSGEIDSERRVCTLASKVDNDDYLLAKRFSGLKTGDLIYCDNDVSLSSALNFVFSGLQQRFLLGEMTEKLKSALVPYESIYFNSRPKPHSRFTYGRTVDFYNWLQITEFPQAFVDVFPWLFDKVPHEPEKCPYKTCSYPLGFAYKCWQCNEFLYKHLRSPGLSRNDGWHSNKVPFADVAHLLQIHATANPNTPYKFWQLEILVKKPKENEFYDSNKLHEVLLCEMLEFCLVNRSLDLLQILWDNFYCPDQFIKWTSCFQKSIDAFATSSDPVDRVSFFDSLPKPQRSAEEDEEDRRPDLDYLVGVDETEYQAKRRKLLKYLLR